MQLCDTKSRWVVRSGLGLLAGMALCSAPYAQVTGYQQGKGGSPVQGAAGTNGSTGSAVQHCDKPMGAMAVVEPQDLVLQSLLRYNLSSPTALIRMMIQQSNCFIVVERGIAMQNMKQERALAGSDELRSGSNIGSGQMMGADFILTPNVVFSESNAGGLGAGLASMMLPGVGGAVMSAVAGGLKFKEAQTSMLVADSRSGVQVASAEGSTKKADLHLGGILLGGSGGGSLGGYGNTNEGKIIAAAYLDNYNKIVNVISGDPSLQRNVETLHQEAAKVTASGAVFNEGDVVVPKIANVKLYANADDSGKPSGTLGRGEQVVVIGAEQNGFIKVQGGAVTGWVKKVLVTRGD